MKPYRLPSEFAALTPEQLRAVHRWVQELTYEDAREKLNAELDIQMSRNKLHRYYQKADLSDDLSDPVAGVKVDVQDLLNMLNGDPIPFDQAGIALIQKRAFDLACEPNTSPAKLATLLRIFHYKTSLQMNQRRQAQTDERIQISHRLATVREEELKLKKSGEARAARSADIPVRPPTASHPLKSLQGIPVHEIMAMCLSEEEKEKLAREQDQADEQLRREGIVVTNRSAGFSRQKHAMAQNASDSHPSSVPSRDLSGRTGEDSR